MKQLLLLNPRRQKRSRRRKLRSSRRVRRNPTVLGFHFGRTKKTKSRHRKLGRRAKRSVYKFLTKRRESILSPRRIRSLLGGRRKKSTSPIRMKSSRRRRRNPVHRRRHHRRLRLLGSRQMLRNPIDINGLFSQTNIGIAGGVVAGTQVTSYVLNNFGASLPGVSSPYGLIFYRFAIPAGFGIALAKWSKSSLTEAIGLGFVISGLVNAGGSLISMFTQPQPVVAPSATPATAATNAYLGAYLGNRRQPMGAYISPRTMGEMPRIVRNLPVAMNGAFKNDAWNMN